MHSIKLKALLSTSLFIQTFSYNYPDRILTSYENRHKFKVILFVFVYVGIIAKWKSVSIIQ